MIFLKRTLPFLVIAVIFIFTCVPSVSAASQHVTFGLTTGAQGTNNKWITSNSYVDYDQNEYYYTDTLRYAYAQDRSGEFVANPVSLYTYNEQLINHDMDYSTLPLSGVHDAFITVSSRDYSIPYPESTMYELPTWNWSGQVYSRVKPSITLIISIENPVTGQRTYRCPAALSQAGNVWDFSCQFDQHSTFAPGFRNYNLFDSDTSVSFLLQIEATSLPSNSYLQIQRYNAYTRFSYRLDQVQQWIKDDLLFNGTNPPDNSNFGGDIGSVEDSLLNQGSSALSGLTNLIVQTENFFRSVGYAFQAFSALFADLFANSNFSYLLSASITLGSFALFVNLANSLKSALR